MRLRRKTIGFLLGVLATLAGVIVLSLVLNREYPSTQTARRSFTIDQDFTDIRKILVRNDAAKQIVAMGGGSEFLSQDWRTIGFESDRPLDELINPNWRVQLHGTLRVRTKDEYVGEHNIELGQDVEIKPDFLNSEVHLKGPAERLKQYNMKTRFHRDEQTGKAKVDLELTQEILTDAPWFAHGIADRRVRESAEKTLANQERAIRQLIAENKDNIPVFPLR